MILLIDNYDSFTYNLEQYLGNINNEIQVIKNDYKDFDSIDFKKISHIVISPGPGSAAHSKLSLEAINYSIKIGIPLLGICLGHQAIALAFGCKVVRANEIMHGKISNVTHNGKSLLFQEIPLSFSATRYHSLIVDKNINSRSITITSLSDRKEIMSIEHKKYPIYGLQFHPESILTSYGIEIMNNFINIV